MDFLTWSMNVLFANFHSVNTSVKVRNSVKIRRKEGRAIGPVPIGYENMRDPDTKKAFVVLDKDRDYLIKEIFILYSSGNYSIEKIAEIISKKGLRSKVKPYSSIHKSHLHSILNNRFYCGYILNRKSGEYTKHNYDIIVDEWLWNKCQDVKNKHSNQPFKFDKTEHLFAGLTHCDICGCAYSTDFQRKKNIKYLFCTKYHRECNNSRVPEKKIDQQVAKLFEKIVIPEVVIKSIAEKLKKETQKERDYRDILMKNAQDEHAHIITKLDHLIAHLFEPGFDPYS